MTNETIFRLDNALDKLKEAFNELSSAWEEAEYDNADIGHEILSPDYPFNDSFDDLAGEVRTWTGLCKGRLLTELIKIVKQDEQNKRSVSED